MRLQLQHLKLLTQAQPLSHIELAHRRSCNAASAVPAITAATGDAATTSVQVLARLEVGLTLSRPVV